MPGSPGREQGVLKGRGQGQGSNRPSRSGMRSGKSVPRRGGKTEDSVLEANMIPWKPREEGALSRRPWSAEPGAGGGSQGRETQSGL